MAILLPCTSRAQKKDLPIFSQAEVDSTSYLLGVNFGLFLKKNNVKGLDYNRIKIGMSDYLVATESGNASGTLSILEFSPDEMNDCLDSYLEKDTHTLAEVSKASYLMGVNFGIFVKAYNFPGTDFDAMENGMKDMASATGNPESAVYGRQFRYDPTLMIGVFNRAFAKQQEISAKSNKLQADEFLRVNAGQPEVFTTSSGLQYKIILKGSTSYPTDDSDVKVLYTLKNIAGEQLDASQDESAPAEFNLGNAVYGVREGLQLIGEGGQIILYVPADLAYGDAGNQVVEPGALIIYDIELMEVMSNASTSPTHSTQQTASSSYSTPSSTTPATSRTSFAAESFVSHGVARIIKGKEFTMRKGETIKIRPSGPESNIVTKLETIGSTNVYAITGTDEIMGISSGEANLWVYINGSPKFFTVKVLGSATGSASDSGIVTSSTNTTIPVNGMAKLTYGGGKVTRWENTNEDIVAVFENGVIIGLEPGVTTVWGYVNGYPKRFSVSVSNTVPASYSSPTAAVTSSPSSSYTSSSSSSSSGSLRKVYGREVSLRVGEKIQLMHTDGFITKTEVTAENNPVSATDTGVVTGDRSGEAIVWGYVNGSPKYFHITVSR